MDNQVLQSAKGLSVQVIRDAGKIAKDRFGKFTTLKEKDEYGDVITEVDHLAEDIILQTIGRAFPDHRIHSEEAGDNGRTGEWQWLIDPLDGTNNYAVGLPVFSSSITLLYKKDPVLGVVYEPMTDRLYVSSIHEGAFCNQQQMKVKMKAEIRKGTIGWIQGHQVQNQEEAVKLRQHLDLNFKRMMRLWAPTLQWCMLAKGDIDGIVLYHSEGDDLYSGILMVQEAGGAVFDFQGNPFRGMKEEPYLIACHPAHKEYFLKLVEEGLA